MILLENFLFAYVISQESIKIPNTLSLVSLQKDLHVKIKSYKNNTMSVEITELGFSDARQEELKIARNAPAMSKRGKIPRQDSEKMVFLRFALSLLISKPLGPIHFDFCEQPSYITTVPGIRGYKHPMELKQCLMISTSFSAASQLVGGVHKYAL